MQLSRYLKIWPAPERPGINLLYSTRNAALAMLPEAACQALARGEEVPEQIVAHMRQLGMLVTDLEAERQAVFAMHSEINRLHTGVNAAIILNLDCNFACRYCYEGTMKGRYYMTDAVADQVIAFLKGRFREGKDKLSLDFYGGEPLLSLDRIRYFSTALKPYVEERGGKYTLNLVTNGSLLTRRTVQELREWGLESAKVTIDGPAANHNHYRPFKSGKESFAVILANVKGCCDLIEIFLNGNFVPENYQDFPLLLETLQAEGLGPDKLAWVRFHPVMQATSRYSILAANSGCAAITEPWLLEAAVFLRQEILRRGYNTPKITPEICMAELHDAFTVHYNGDIYNCPALIGHEQFVVGDVWSGEQDYHSSHHLDNWREDENCSACEYLPMCFGGCRYMTFLRDNRMHGVDCRKAFLDAALEPFIRQDVQYRYGSGGGK